MHLAYVATLPCETVMSAKQALNDKFQGSLAAYVRCGGVVNNQIKKRLLLSPRIKKIFKSVNIWQSYKSYALSSSFTSVLDKRAKCMRQPHNTVS